MREKSMMQNTRIVIGYTLANLFTLISTIVISLFLTYPDILSRTGRTRNAFRHDHNEIVFEFVIRFLIACLTIILISSIIEFIFRYAPIKLTKRYSDSSNVLTAVIITSSILFGFFMTETGMMRLMFVGRNENLYFLKVACFSILGLSYSGAFLKTGFLGAIFTHTLTVVSFIGMMIGITKLAGMFT